MKELAAENVNLQWLFESQPTEAILIIVSPATDPSQKLVELSKVEIGIDKYHQVAMGQAEIARTLLHQCASDGEWL